MKKWAFRCAKEDEKKGARMEFDERRKRRSGEIGWKREMLNRKHSWQKEIGRRKLENHRSNDEGINKGLECEGMSIVGSEGGLWP